MAPGPGGVLTTAKHALRGAQRLGKQKQAEELIRRSHAVDVFLQRKAAAASLSLLKEDLKTVSSVPIATTLDILDRFDEKPDPVKVEAQVEHMEWHVDNLRREHDEARAAATGREAELRRLADELAASFSPSPPLLLAPTFSTSRSSSRRAHLPL